jgi:predicted nucleotidyltransferase
MMELNHIELPTEQIQQFCDRWQIRELALFGSVLRDDFRTDSDIDVLVSFHPDAHPTLFTLVDIQAELATLFNRKVDLVTREGIKNSRNPFRRQNILSSAVTVYDARQSIPI